MISEDKFGTENDLEPELVDLTSITSYKGPYRHYIPSKYKPNDPAGHQLLTHDLRAVGPNQSRTFTVRRKVAKRTEPWYLEAPSPHARKKPRREEPQPLPTPTASPDMSRGLSLPAATPSSTDTVYASARRGIRRQTQLPPIDMSEPQLHDDTDYADNANDVSDLSRSFWEDRLSDLADYFKNHGQSNVPKNYCENTRLGKWVANQRCQYKLHLEGNISSITTYRIQALESLGFEWDSHEAAWEVRLSELADYRTLHGHCDVPRKYSENTKLANWVAKQREQYKLHLEGEASTMTPSRIQELERLGFE
jgi:hypothetical protein